MDIKINKKHYLKNFKKKTILKNIRLSFTEGETTLIIGTSGAGKSTLIKCIIGATGYEGIATGYDKRDIAYIPQHPALNMSQTVYDTIYYNLKFAHLDGKKYGGHDAEWWTKKYINDVALTPVCDQRNENLSGGQRQRVSIAKELARDKKIIIADEIDTGLDCGVAKSLVESLCKITHEHNVTTIVISHNLINIELYDNVIVLVRSSEGIGQIAYAGKTKYIKEYFGVNDYVEILTKVNCIAEGGDGKADYFIAKHLSSKQGDQHK